MYKFPQGLDLGSILYGKDCVGFLKKDPFSRRSLGHGSKVLILVQLEARIKGSQKDGK